MQLLRTDHIDRGTSGIVMDALGLPVITSDAKNALTLMAYDSLQRPTKIWARDTSGEPVTLRQIMTYGDAAGLTDPELLNLKGQLYTHNDEAGKLTYTEYDFKGNLLNFYRQVIRDAAVAAYQKYIVNWNDFNPAHLSATQHTTTSEYDALNRIRKALYPEALNSQRLELIPTYNKGGALYSLQLGGNAYVEEVAYNARGQRLLMAMDNGIMSRYTYDPDTFRLVRTRSAKFAKSGLTYTPDGGVRQDLAYRYDLEGSILSQRDRATANNTAQGPGNLLREFTHDPLRRLLSATGRESSNVYAQPSWDLNIRPQDHSVTNLYTRTYAYDKIGNVQHLKHVAVGESNQNFVRNYNYDNPADNRLSSFTVDSSSFANTYDNCGNLTKEGSTRYLQWTHNDKLATFSNQAGSSDPTVYTNYFYNSAGERVKKITRKGLKLEVTVYVDGGLFELTYTKPTGSTIDPDRHYNTLYIKDGASIIASSLPEV